MNSITLHLENDPLENKHTLLQLTFDKCIQQKDIAVTILYEDIEGGVLQRDFIIDNVYKKELPKMLRLLADFVEDKVD